MRKILFILIIFIKIFENMAGNENEGEPSQRKDKRPIIDLNFGQNSPNTDGQEYSPNEFADRGEIFGQHSPDPINFGHQQVAGGIKIGGEDGQLANPSKKPKLDEPKIIQIGDEKYYQTDTSNFVQQFTAMNPSVNDNQEFVHFPQQHRQKQQHLGQHPAIGIGQGSSLSAGVPIPGHNHYQHQINLNYYQHLINGRHQFVADPNETANFAHEIINSYDKQKLRELLLNIDGNLNELKEELFKLQLRINSFSNAERNANNLFLKTLQQKHRTNLEYEKTALMEICFKMETQKQQIIRKIQNNEAEVRARKGHH